VATRTDALGAHALVQEGAQLVDVLPRSIYEQERLPGAVSLPLESLDGDAAFAALDPHATTVVYCFDQH
jgi:rhodanese-related sulfurtransferase